MVPIVAQMLIAQILAYLIGGVPFGYLIARARAGIDIREHGSGNIGATNVGRVLGFRFFLLVFLLDFLKGVLPVLAARWFQAYANSANPDSTYEIFGLDVLVGLAAILGHMFPVYLSLRGGKGVATSIGVITVLAPVECLLGLAVWFMTVGVTRMVALGSLFFAWVFAVSHFVLEPDPFSTRAMPMALFVTVVAILVTVAHRGNIVRMVNGTEPKIRFPWHKKDAPAAEDKP